MDIETTLPDATIAAQFFLLQALDPELGGPAYETRFSVEDMDSLREILGEDAADDRDLTHLYYPDAPTLAKISDRFRAPFDAAGRTVRLHRLSLRGSLPYVAHGGHELQLLLDGTKKYGFIDHHYPPDRHSREDDFDLHVASGELRKKVVTIPYESGGSRYLGFRQVFYARPGEEWRIEAHELLWSARCSWDATRERLWSMLFGYEEWQTDYWIDHNNQRGGEWSGATLYFSLTGAQLDAVEGAGFRAFPPVGSAPLEFVARRELPTENEALAMLSEGSVALVRANVAGLFLLRNSLLGEQMAPVVPNALIPELNRNIVGKLALVARR